MSSKNNTEVIIDGKIFTLSGYESEDYLQKVATYINNKITEYKKNDSFKRQPADVRATLVTLNIADDYFKAKKQADTIESDMEVKDKQLYDIKHQLIAAQIQNESLQKEIDELKLKLNDAQKDTIRLEARLTEIKESTPAPKEKKTTTTKRKTAKKDNIADMDLSNFDI